MKVLSLIFVLLIQAPFIWLSGGQSNAQTLRLGYIEFPPVFSTADDGTAKGLLIDLAAQVIPHAGYDWEATSFPVRRMAEYIVGGKLDLWIGLKTLPEFKGTTVAGDSELLRVELRAYSMGVKPKISKREDLIGKSIIILRGYSYGGWVGFIKNPENKVQFIETRTHRAAFQMLRAGRADFLLDYRRPSERVLSSSLSTGINSNEISSFGVYFVISLKTPGARQILKKLEDAHRELLVQNLLKPTQ